MDEDHGRNQDSRDERMDEDHGRNQDSRDERMTQDYHLLAG
ncbi:hypothetical protein [Sphingobacterium mizutaii]